MVLNSFQNIFSCMIELNTLRLEVSFRSWKTGSEKLHDLSKVTVLCAPGKK